MADLLYCKTCGKETPHYKTRHGSWHQWSCSICRAMSDDTPARREQQEAEERQRRNEETLVNAQLSDLGHQIVLLRTALQSIADVCGMERDDPLASKVWHLCEEVLRR